MIVGPVGTVKKPSVVGEAFSSRGGNPRSLRIPIAASVSTGLLLFCLAHFSLAHPGPPFFLWSVLRKRYDSVPVSMMCAWSVSRSSIALHNLAFGNIVVHSEKGRFVVTITAALSARPAMI